MTSRLQRKTSSLVAIGALAGLVAFIVLLWCVFARHSATPPRPPLTTPGPQHTDNKGPPVSSHIIGYVNDLDTELVRLVKVNPPPIQGHDFVYDLQKAPQNSTNNSEVNKEHHSGHFRHLHTELWDPHPQYIIHAFGMKLHLALRHGNGVHFHGNRQQPSDTPTRHERVRAGPGPVHVTHVFHNHSRRVQAENVGTRTRGCYYTGIVLDEPKDSHVAVSLCGGMTGYIRTKEGNFYIEPVEIYYNSSSQSSLLHRIHRVSASSTQKLIPEESDTCDTNTDPQPDFNQNNKIIFDDILTEETSHRITKRSSWIKHQYNTIATPQALYQSKNREYFIEILVVADKTMFEYHKTNESLTHYILTLMSHVSLLYKDATIGNPVSMYVKDIMILQERVFVHRKSGSSGVNSAEMLKNFCAFQNTMRDYGSGFSHDVAILLTRETICRNTATGQCDTLGLAELGTMCSSQSSCAIIKDKGLPTSYTIAHELGHVLNMPHDDDEEKCSRFNSPGAGVKYIMGRMIRNDSKPWLWSNCSRRYLSEYLESKRANCLLDEPKQDMVVDNNHSRALPGENFDGNKQCELVFGSGLKLCTYMPKCKYLWCELNTEKDGGCQTQHQPWADGTQCAPGAWCHRGLCVPRDLALLEPVIGGWGPWRRQAPCSRTCGGGVRRVERDCDNPRPRNGGPYCIGPSVRYESCNVENCDPEDEDFRESQCGKFNGNTMGVPGLTSSVRWVPKYEGILPEEYCLLYCRVQHTNQHYLLSDRVIDGTKCGFNSLDVCVNGVCRRGGCDNRLGSTLQLDACGVCGGDNSQCEQMEGAYNAQPIYGYSKVVRLPKGSSNLDIRQYGWERDGNYLALVDSETGQYVMNGDHILHAYPTVFMYGGVTLSYTGTDVSIERINSSGSVRLKKDLLVELLSVDKLRPPNITYSYMIARGSSPAFTWQLYESSWSPCSRICSGNQRAVPACTSVHTGNVVGDEFCEHLPRDVSSSRTRECNTHCRLLWRVKQKFSCSAHCGRGVRTVFYQCVRLETVHQHVEAAADDEDANVPWATPVDDKHCSDLEKPPEVEACEGSCDETRWKYDEWSQCSRSCGGGSQHRTALCVDSASRPVDSAQCSTPVLSQPCNPQRCPTWIVEEWTTCNASCGRGMRMRPYFCQVEGRVLRADACDPATLPVWEEECVAPGRPTCARWITGEWGRCLCESVPLVQRRLVECRDYNAAEVQETSCQGLLRPNETRLCPPGDVDVCAKTVGHFEDNLVVQGEFDGFEWRSGPWSQCSRTCGAGSKSRNVACQDISSGALVTVEHCDPILRPVARVSCGTQACPSWNTGEWSACTVDCRQRFRLVQCQDHSGRILAPQRCPAAERPTNTSSCMADPHCTLGSSGFSSHRYKWRFTDWGPCSRSCGRGMRNRFVSCVDVIQNATLVDQLCQQRKPKSQKPCHKSECTHVWIEGPWSTCSASCDEGVRHRDVTCVRVLPHGRSGPLSPSDQTCDPTSRPKTSEKCFVRSCSMSRQFNWAAGPWKACSHSCGPKGRQIRQLYCQYQNKKVPKKNCPRSLKPQRKQKCNQRKCSPHAFRSCLDVKRELRAVHDGEFEMTAGGRNAIVKIYCHKMASATPEEFLTLKDEGRENYAEFYGKQLLDPDSCPQTGHRHENCPCRSDDSGTAGLTLFFRIKLNLSNLQVITDDFTFSHQMSGVRIPFGTAGDCYSRTKCPQGRFSINLTGTGFRVDERVRWIATGVHANFSIANQNSVSVSGKCGGYCGTCVPDSRLGLLLEPDGAT